MPALAAPPPRPQTRATVARTMPAVGIAPLPGETQGRFVDRCLRSLNGSTDQRNATCYAAWERSGRERDLQQIAREQFPADKFRRVPNRPLFVEHSRTRTITDPQTGQEREVVEKYDRDALEAITERLNERIRDTRDFSPLVAGHTPSEESRENGVEMPDVLGYAGPFRLGVIGNVKPRFAIFGDEYHHIEETPRLSKLQRRSPEVWLEEKMQDRFFDPIACLGAETPRLDLGLTRFCRTADGRQVAKYSSLAVEPSGATTFIPSDTGERRKLDQNAAGDKPMALAPEDVKQIVDALQQLPWVQWVKDQMNDGVNDGTGGAGDPAGAPGAVPPPMPGADSAGAMPPPDAGAPPVPPPPDDNPDQNAAPRAMYECDDDDREAMSKYAAGELDDAGFMGHMQSKKQAYQAGSVEAPGVGDPAGNPTVVDPQVAAYNRNGKGRGDWANKYARLEKEHATLKARVDRAESEKREHYRRRKLTERQYEGFAFDLDDEIKLTADMTDKQFDRHVESVVVKYERAPVGMIPLYTPPMEPTTKQNQKYARDRAEKAQKLILREREKGSEISWDEACERVDAANA